MVIILSDSVVTLHLDSDKLAYQNLCQDLYSRSKIGPVFYTLSTIITGFLADFHTSLSLPFIAAIVVLVIVAILRLISRPPENTKVSLDTSIKKHWILVFSCVLTWSSFFSWTIYQLGLSSAFIFGLVSTINFSTAIVHQYSPQLKRALFCSLFCLLPAAITIVLFSPQLEVAALAIFLYLPYLVFTAKNSNKEYFYHLNNKLKLEAALVDLEVLSKTDAQTGLYNRREFNHQIKSALNNSNQQTLGLILLDIDNFKKINDNYSHTAGDDCLVHVASVLKQVFTDEGDIISRVGGEEFAVILFRENEHSILNSANKLQHSLSSTICSANGHEISVTASIGVVCNEAEKDITVPHLYDMADNAMYRAKKNGKNRVEYAKPY